MSSILIDGTAIIGIDPIDAGDVWRLSDLVVPKRGQQLVSPVTIPNDWAPGKYTWGGSDFEAVIVAAPPTPVPSSVTMRQARIALLAAGLLDDVETAIAGLSSPTKERAQIEWEYSNEVQRNNGIVAQLGPLLGLSSAQIDALFIQAAAL